MTIKKSEVSEYFDTKESLKRRAEEWKQKVRVEVSAITKIIDREILLQYSKKGKVEVEMIHPSSDATKIIVKNYMEAHWKVSENSGYPYDGENPDFYWTITLW